MAVQPLKPPLTIEEQLELLKSRGLTIDDEAFATKTLEEVNYYRLSAYSLGLRHNDIFLDDINFEQIYYLYKFDTKFRSLLLEKIEHIEIMFRTRIAYYLAINYGPLSYTDESYFVFPDRHSSLIAEFEVAKQKQKDAAFVKHHNDKYGGIMPIWVAIELFSFGMLSKFYSNLKTNEKKHFVWYHLHKSREYGICLPSWLKSLVEVRNICAHYGRIYNRALTSQPRMLPMYNSMNLRPGRIFSVLIVIIHMLDNYTESTSFIIQIKALIEEYPSVNLSFIGFPENWEEVLLLSR